MGIMAQFTTNVCIAAGLRIQPAFKIQPVPRRLLTATPKPTPKPTNTVIENAAAHVASHVSLRANVVLECKTLKRASWSYPQWQAVYIAVGENFDASQQRVSVAKGDDYERFLWTGLKLDLFIDGSEGYWYNLLSEQPYLFIVCSGEVGEFDIEPDFVTASQDEANAHMESDDQVLSLAMPPEVCELLEQYVVKYFAPMTKKKRKRRAWLDESEYAKRIK